MMKDNRTFKFILFVCVLMSIITLSAMTFAYFTTKIEEGNIFTTTGKAKNSNLRIKFTENRSGISLSNTYPMPNSKGLELDSYIFTIENEEPDTVVKISVILEVTDSSNLDDGLVNVAVSDKIITLNSDISWSPSSSEYKTAYKIVDYILKPGDSLTRELRIWINDNGTLDNSQNKIWSSRILIVPEVHQNIVDNIIASSQGVRTDFNTVATTDEGVYELDDDYGKSYYYRGSVEDNYVKFGKNKEGSDMYWRIIRINGDGSLRMIYDGTSAHANGEASEDRLALTNVQWNSNSDDAKYVGYMYGGPNGEASSSKEQAQTNETDSNIKTKVDAWYKENIVDTGYSQYISDEIFCNDRSTPGSAVTLWPFDTGLGYEKNTTTYGAFGRFLTGNNKMQPHRLDNPQPILNCLQKNDAFTVSDTTKGNGSLTNPVGLITADEVILAGGSYFLEESFNNRDYYLSKGFNYWTFSPYYTIIGASYSAMFSVEDVGSMILNNIGYDLGVSPVINIAKEFTTDMVGSGTIDDPYRSLA